MIDILISLTVTKINQKSGHTCTATDIKVELTLSSLTYFEVNH